MTEQPVTFRMLDGDQALGHVNELRDLYREIYADPPYQWGTEHADLFAERLYVQARQPGFALVDARCRTELVGIAFGVTLQPTTPWWQHLITPLPADITEERVGRTFALVELLVRRPWRRRHIAQTMHDLLLKDRPEERATLTVLPAAEPAQRAYVKWGWQTVTQKRNPLPGSPVFDVLVKSLNGTTQEREAVELIYHIAASSDWEQARRVGAYTTSTRGRSLDEVGFIHGSTGQQVALVANAVYRGDDGLVVLVIDAARVRPEIRYEQIPGWDDPFPHIYGPLNVDAVVKVLPFESDGDGRFSFASGI